jgi:hypothetical protein
MTDQPRRAGENSDLDEAPELHNSEQEDEQEQTHIVAGEALHGEARRASPLDSVKVNGGIGDNSEQDVIDRMRDMEQSGRVDMGAYRGEPNHDDNEDMYGPESKLDDLPADGTDDEPGGARGDSPA